MTKQMMRVAIADDHRLMLDGIKRALETAPDITVVGEAMSGDGMLEIIPQCDPDIVILDLRMPNGDGLETLTRIRERHPALKVIILSMFDDSEHVDQALRRGADGYVVKSINPLDLPSTIRQVVEGTVHLRGVTIGTEASGADHDSDHGGTTGGEIRGPVSSLTDRELSILKLVAEGLSNMDIANKLFVTEQTVKFHLSNIYRKLGVSNRTEATRHAYRSGIIE